MRKLEGEVVSHYHRFWHLPLSAKKNSNTKEDKISIMRVSNGKKAHSGLSTSNSAK